jgi:hypothetical protein
MARYFLAKMLNLGYKAAFFPRHYSIVKSVHFA